jgi:molybdenum-dependent DNA-binding transcriptional regulator ModE
MEAGSEQRRSTGRRRGREGSGPGRSALTGRGRRVIRLGRPLEQLVETLLACLGALLALVALDLLALRFGVSSRDGCKEVWW